MTGTIQTIPPTFYQVAFNADPNQAAVPPWFTDVSNRTQFGWSTGRGRHYELDVMEAGEWRPTLANPDGALDPSNAASPYAPGVVPYRQGRIRCLPGVNLLSIDQATAGEGSGYAPGPIPGQMNITSATGVAPTIGAAAAAFTGTQVFTATVPAGAAFPQDALRVSGLPVMPALAYAGQMHVRIPAGAQSMSTHVSMNWLDSSGNTLSTVSGSNVTVPGGSASWTLLTAAGTAPAGAVFLTLRLVTATSPVPTTVYEIDGLQLEQNAFATTYQQPFTLSTNMFPRGIATGGLSQGSATGLWYPDAGTLSYATGLTASPTGHTNAVGWTTPPGTTGAPNLWAGPETGNPSLPLGRPSTDNIQVAAGTAYTASVYMLRAASADVTLAVTSAIIWFSSSGTYISSNSGSPLTLSTGSWGRLTVTGTAPAGAAWGRFALWMTTPATTSANNTFYLTGGQFEAAGAASTWSDPGTAYSIITPYIERWPQNWSQMSGTYGTCDVVGVDALAALAQTTLQDPYVNEVLALGPNFLIELNEPAGATSCTDTAGKRPAAPVENGPFGAGSLTFGNPVTATAVPSGGFLGGAGPVATFNNNSNGSASAQFPETYISLHKTAAVPGPPSNGVFTRLIAFRCSTIPPSATSDNYTIWFTSPPSWTGGGLLRAQIINTTGALSVTVSGATGGLNYNSGSSVCDGNWHLLGMGMNAVSGAVEIWLDGASVATGTGLTAATTFASDVLGAQVLLGAQQFRKGLVGDLAHAVEFPFLLTDAQMTNLYNSWRSASSGESTGARAKRVLAWIGWPGTAAIDTGATTSMGPATDLAGATALDALNNIAITENGNVYAAANGTLTFKARTARYGQLTPTYIFGEKTPAGEWPFEYLGFEYDPSHIMSDVQITQYGGATSAAFDAPSRARTFPRVYQRTINSTSLPETADAANYLLGQNKVAHLRVETLRLHPSAVPGLFLVCLNLEIGTRVRVNRRPQNGPQITFDGFVEHVEWEWDPDTGDVFVNVQCSPADLSNYWQLAALHTTLNLQAASGQNRATINALPDAAVNKLAQSLPSGYSLTFEPGTAQAETLTIAAGGIPSTLLGYASAQLTFTTNFAFTHAAGTVVCEPLPAGVSDATTWDAASVLGVSYATITAVGTNSVTVSVLPDAKVNSLGSTWNVGDVVWVSPGVPAHIEAMTIQSVSATYPGYTTATITFTANFGLTHLVGEYVSDPLANNGINPTTVSATTRLAY